MRRPPTPATRRDWRGRRRRRHFPWPTVPSRRASASVALMTRAAPPGSYRTLFHANVVSPDSIGENSRIRLRRFSAASRSRRYSTGSSSLRSGPSSTIVDALAASSMVARSSPSTAGGNPSPSWASRRSIPTASASLAHAYRVLVGAAGPPRSPIAAGPPASSASRTNAAATPSAPFHDVSAKTDSPRTSGAPRRSAELTASKSNRPRSHSQPQLTGSESTPW